MSEVIARTPKKYTLKSFRKRFQDADRSTASPEVLKLNEDIIKIFEQVEKSVGQYILVVERKYEEVCSHPTSADDYKISSVLSLGVVRSDETTLDENFFNFEFDTGRIHGSTQRYWKSEQAKKDGNLCIPKHALSVAMLGRPVMRPGLVRHHDPGCYGGGGPDAFGHIGDPTHNIALEIIVGDDSVEEWFKERNLKYEGIFRELCEAVGRHNKAMQAEAKKQLQKDTEVLLNRLKGYEELIVRDLREAVFLGVGSDAIVKFWNRVLDK